ncbi:unnamed protein product [Musa acuminata subsp. malaccensis]|uniref:(wild Malaysian banana) hypothetical protein n=1 Tax=Musa acuminata subsp. malaccensis TaxID=214687 RepID=A0A804KAL9_MUSAM|nr:unnamed protein product [Musa acuminata subsp. malaccensis]
MVGIPNGMLAMLATSMKAAQNWVSRNVSEYIYGRVHIRYFSIGNEPFSETDNGSFLQTTFPALQNIQGALIKAGLSSQVKVTIPLNADVYQSSSRRPSDGDFRADIHDLVLTIVKFLSDNAAPFTVNIYPFISLYGDPNFPVDYAFFEGKSVPVIDGTTNYTNMFDANHDTLIWALKKNGYGDLPIIVGEIGWPTDGDMNANTQYAQRFNQGFMNHILINEDEKSIRPGNFERHRMFSISTRNGASSSLQSASTIQGWLQVQAMLVPMLTARALVIWMYEATLNMHSIATTRRMTKTERNKYQQYQITKQDGDNEN